jgi:hypothetical protein
VIVIVLSVVSIEIVPVVGKSSPEASDQRVTAQVALSQVRVPTPFNPPPETVKLIVTAAAGAAANPKAAKAAVTHLRVITPPCLLPDRDPVPEPPAR